MVLKSKPFGSLVVVNVVKNAEIFENFNKIGFI